MNLVKPSQWAQDRIDLIQRHAQEWRSQFSYERQQRQFNCAQIQQQHASLIRQQANALEHASAIRSQVQELNQLAQRHKLMRQQLVERHNQDVAALTSNVVASELKTADYSVVEDWPSVNQ